MTKQQLEKKLKCFELYPNYPVIEIKPKNKRGEYLYFAVNPGVFQYCTYLGGGENYIHPDLTLTTARCVYKSGSARLIILSTEE